MYRLFALVYPKKMKEIFSKLLIYSNIKINAEKFLGFIFVFNFLISLLLGFFIGKFYKF